MKNLALATKNNDDHETEYDISLSQDDIDGYSKPPKGYNHGVALANYSKAKRRELDFYPTPPEVTNALMNFLNLEPCIVWEPACGMGSMSKVIESHGHKVYSSDIDTAFGDSGMDFLTVDCKTFDAIITNPPFNLSEKFIRHALQMTPIVAMVLKSQYWHATKRTALFNELPPSYVLALSWRPDFLFDQRKVGDKKAAPTMECIWTVWIDGDTDTKYRILSKGKK